MSIRGLAIETSGSVGSVALVQDGIVVASDIFPHGLQHAAKIIPAIDALCTAQRWLPADIREVYVSAGPGSFTGLRIGITLAKTLAFATGAKVVPVPTVNVLAQNAPVEARYLIIVLDAKRGQIFTARFEKFDDAWVVQQEARLSTLADMLADSPRPVYLLGEGLPYHADKIPAGDASVICAAEETWRASASAVAKLGYAAAQRGEFVDAMQLTPIYIRMPEAQEKWEAARREISAK